VDSDPALRRSQRHAQILAEFATGMAGRSLLAVAAVTAAVVGAQHLPAPWAEPLVRALPALTAAAPRGHWATGLLVVIGLLAASVRLIAAERSGAPRGRAEKEPEGEVSWTARFWTLGPPARRVLY